MSKDLGLVSRLGADAVGQPGQRRFRLFASSSEGSAIMWMEKEELNRLSLLVDRVLAQISEGQVLRTEAEAGQMPSTPGMPPDFPLRPDFDFQVAELSMTYDERNDRFLLTASPLEIEEAEGQEVRAWANEEEAVSFLFSQFQAQELTRNITLLVRSGRPVCPLCGTPLDGSPHACVKQNGHREIVQVIEGEEGEGNE